jgi:hypothetical protein
MAIRLPKLYVALRAANVPEDEARAAAEEVAEWRGRAPTPTWQVLAILVSGGAVFFAAGATFMKAILG